VGFKRVSHHSTCTLESIRELLIQSYVTQYYLTQRFAVCILPYLCCFLSFSFFFTCYSKINHFNAQGCKD